MKKIKGLQFVCDLTNELECLLEVGGDVGVVVVIHRDAHETVL